MGVEPTLSFIANSFSVSNAVVITRGYTKTIFFSSYAILESSYISLLPIDSPLQGFLFNVFVRTSSSGKLNLYCVAQRRAELLEMTCLLDGNVPVTDLAINPVQRGGGMVMRSPPSGWGTKDRGCEGTAVQAWQPFSILCDGPSQEFLTFLGWG